MKENPKMQQDYQGLLVCFCVLMQGILNPQNPVQYSRFWFLSCTYSLLGIV